MKKIALISYFFVCVFLMDSVDGATLVLQQGLNGYSGCTDIEMRDPTSGQLKIDGGADVNHFIIAAGT